MTGVLCLSLARYQISAVLSKEMSICFLALSCPSIGLHAGHVHWGHARGTEWHLAVFVANTNHGDLVSCLLRTVRKGSNPLDILLQVPLIRWRVRTLLNKLHSTKVRLGKRAVLAPRFTRCGSYYTSKPWGWWYYYVPVWLCFRSPLFFSQWPSAFISSVLTV